jgi:hypothetical protein
LATGSRDEEHDEMDREVEGQRRRVGPGGRAVTEESYTVTLRCALCDKRTRPGELAPPVAHMGINAPAPHYGGGPVPLGNVVVGAWWIAPANLRTIEAVGHRTGATHPDEVELLTSAQRRTYETENRGPLNEKVQVSGIATGSKIDLVCPRGHVAHMRRTKLEEIAEDARREGKMNALVAMNNRA